MKFTNIKLHENYYQEGYISDYWICRVFLTENYYEKYLMLEVFETKCLK